MNVKVFIDSNIFIYGYSNNDEIKKTTTIKWLEKYDCISSTQAINELSNVFLRRYNYDVEQVKNIISEIQAYCDVRLINIDVIKHALNIHEKYGYSYYDCLMLSAAIQNNCAYIFSEDMQDGQKIDGLEIVNIFERGVINDSSN